MDEDVKRIGVGNIRFPGINIEIPTPDLVWTFDSEEITFDLMTRTFDEDI